MKGKTAYDFEAGEVIAIDKPLEWTSFDVVQKIRNTIKVKKVGHAGTLDPLATGLLIVCTGKATKIINTIQEQPKTYTCTMVLGKTTPSVDLETAFDSEKPYDHITGEMVEAILPEFSGAIQQVPPVYSAIKIDGKRAYESARKNVEVIMQARTVLIESLRIVEMKLPEIRLEVVCSKGTYIRSLVRDMGEKLGTGAYLAALRRNAIGEYKVENAFTVDEFVGLFKKKIGNEGS